MSTVAWLLILFGAYLIRATLKGQVQDSNGRFILMENMEKIILGLITNDSKLLKEADSAPESGLTIKPETPPDTSVPPGTPGAAGGGGGGGGGSWSFNLNGNDYPAAWDKLNPRTVREAVEYATSRSTFQSGMCERMVTLAYGYGGGYPTARAHANAMQLHSGMPPKGALVFHNTSNPVGHVCLSVGGGYIVSTDFDGSKYARGRMSVGPISAIDKWGPRMGWSAPIFRK